MKRVILFRFHAYPSVCRNRLRLLRLFNPGADLIGLYGGEERRFPSVARHLEPHLDGLYCLRGKSPEWKWRHSDLALHLWYREQGHRIAFDVLHVVEWDLLLLASVAELFGHVPSDSVGLARMRPAKDAVGRWVWISKEPYRSEWVELLRHVTETYGYAGEPYSCSCAGATLPRAFLERCARERIPALFAQAFGFALVDNRLVDPARPDEERYFNLLARDIRNRDIYNELEKKNGRRAFHPYRRHFVRLTRSGLFPNLFSPLVRKLSALHRRRLNMPGRIGAP